MSFSGKPSEWGSEVSGRPLTAKESAERPELTLLNALRRIDRYINGTPELKDNPDLEEAIALLWTMLMKGV